MAITRIPPNWSADQLAALNELAELSDTINAVSNLLNQFGGDTSPAAARVKADVIDLARATWARVKAYPTP